MLSAAASPAPVHPAVLALHEVALSPKLAGTRANLIAGFENLPYIAEDAALMQDCALGTYHAFRPRNSWDSWLTHRVGLMTMRIDRAERIERKLRDLQALRAIDCWEADQIQAAQNLGAQLASDPKRVRDELRCSPAGCNWLIERWETLEAVPVAEWTDAQYELAYQIDPNPRCFYSTPGYIRLQISYLETARDRLRTANESLRGMTAADLSPEPSRLLLELRRYARSLHRQLKWYVAQLRAEPPKREPNPYFYPQYLTTPPEPTAPEPATAPEPTEADQTNPTAAEAPEVSRTKPNPADHAEFSRTKPSSPASVPAAARTNPRKRSR